MADNDNTTDLGPVSALGVPANVTTVSLNQLLAGDLTALRELTATADSPDSTFYSEIARRASNVAVWAAEINERVDANEAVIRPETEADLAPLIGWLADAFRPRVDALDEALWELEIGGTDVATAIDALVELTIAAAQFKSYRQAMQLQAHD